VAAAVSTLTAKQQFRPVKSMATRLIGKMRLLFGDDNSNVVVKRTKGQDEKGPIYVINEKETTRGWLNDLQLTQFEEERRQILSSSCSEALKQYRKANLFGQSRPVHFWLRLIMRQLTMGSLVKLPGRSGNNPSYDATASQLGMLRLKPVNMIHSTELFIESMIPNGVVEVIDRMLMDDEYLPSMEEMDKVIGGDWEQHEEALS